MFTYQDYQVLQGGAERATALGGAYQPTPEERKAGRKLTEHLRQGAPKPADVPPGWWFSQEQIFMAAQEAGQV